MNELHQTTRGGEHVLIRRAQPEDASLYADFVRDLDYRHEMAFVALDEKSGRMLGLVRLKDELDEETTEFAIMVHSSLKRHGLGWLLMKPHHRLRPGKRAAARVWRRAGR